MLPPSYLLILTWVVAERPSNGITTLRIERVIDSGLVFVDKKYSDTPMLDSFRIGFVHIDRRRDVIEPTGEQFVIASPVRKISAARPAREIDAMDIHDDRAGWALAIHVRVPGSPLYGPAAGVPENWRVIARAASSRPGSSVSRVTFSRPSSRTIECLLALGTSRTA